jgi:hypothetical protein
MTSRSAKFRKPILWALSVVIIASLGGLVLGIVFEDEVKQQIVNEVNQGLNTEITVDHISFSVLRKFPNASLRFQNLMALDAIETNAPKDTLLYASDLFLEFNLFDVFSRNYSIRKVAVSDAVLRLKVDENGHDNFHFWKSKKDSSETQVNFLLNEVTLQNVDFSYRNVQSAFHLNTQIDELELSGNFQEAVFDLGAESALLVQVLEAGQTTYLKNQRTQLQVNTKIDTRNNHYAFNEGAVKFGNLEFKVGGAYQAGDKTHLNLQLDGKGFDIPELLSFIPERFVKPLEGYEPRGNMSFGLSVNGSPNNRDDEMEITAQFAVENAGVKHLKSGLNFKDFSASGTYENRGKHPDVLEIKQFNFKLKDGFLSGNGSVRNFARPTVQFRLNGQAELEDLQEIVSIRSVEYIRGSVSLECLFKGVIANPEKLGVADLQRAEISGRLGFEQTDLKIAGAPHEYSGFTGEFFLNGNNAAVKNLRGKIFSSDFEMDGLFVNFVPFVLIENEKMRIEASLKSNYINLAELMVSGADENQSNVRFELPKFLDLNAGITVKTLEFRTFKAADITGKVNMNSTGVFADPISLSTSGGTFNANMIVKPAPNNHFKVSSEAQIRGIDITQLFTSFGSFGQDFLTDKHLRGNADADVVFKTSMDDRLKLAPESIYSLVDLTISNGELIGHQSLIEVADYIRENKLLAPLVKTGPLKEKLQHVHFSKLSNQIEIKNSSVNIPEMMLESTALNLSASGTHGFNSVVDYRLRFRLTELLTNPKHSEFGDIQDDGTGGSFFLRMNGPINNLQFSYDRMAARERRKEMLKEEKETLKGLIKEEFGGIFGGRKQKEENETDSTKTQQNSTEKEIIINPGKGKTKDEEFWDELEEDDDF